MEPNTKMTRGEARLTLMTAGLILVGRPNSTDPAEIRNWAEHCAQHPDILKVVGSLSPFDGLLDKVAGMAEPRWYNASLESITFKEKSNRYYFDMIKRDRVTGMPVEGKSRDGKRIGVQDGGSTYQITDFNEERVAIAKQLKAQADQLLGQFVQFQKIKDERGYNLILGIRPWVPESLRDQSVDALIAAVNQKTVPSETSNQGGYGQPAGGYQQTAPAPGYQQGQPQQASPYEYQQQGYPAQAPPQMAPQPEVRYDPPAAS